MINKIIGVFPFAFEATLIPLNNNEIYHTKKRIAIIPNTISIHKFEDEIWLINSGLAN
jgi:hypothetical protein